MSSAGETLVRRAFEAWNEGGVDAVEHFFDDLIEWHDIPEVPWTAVYLGKAAVVAYLREFESSGVMGLRFDVVELERVSDQVFVVARVQATGARSGVADAGSEFVYLWRVRDGKNRAGPRLPAPRRCPR